MAEENESSGGARYSLSSFMKLEALIIAGATLLLYLQGLFYVEVFCAGLGAPRELFVLTFSDIILHAWIDLTTQGIVHGSFLITFIVALPAVATLFELILAWVVRKRRKRRIAKNTNGPSREERRLATEFEKRWMNLTAVALAIAIGLGLFLNAAKKSVASAEKAGKARLENKTTSTVTLTNGNKHELVYLARLGETYAFAQPGSDQPRRYVMLPRSEIAKMEFSASEPKAKEEETAPVVPPVKS